MYIKKHIIENASDFVIFNNQLIIIKHIANLSHIGKFNLETLQEEKTRELGSSDYKMLNGEKAVLCREWSLGRGNKDIFLINQNVDNMMELPSSIKLSNNDCLTEYLAIYTVQNKIKNFGVYSLTENKIIWQESSISKLQKIDNYFFSQSGNKLLQHDADTGETIWESDFSEIYPDLKNKSVSFDLKGISKHGVLVGIEKIDRLVSLELLTGKLNWDRHTLPQFYFVDKNKEVAHVMTAAYKCIDLENGKEIRSFLNGDYFEDIKMYSQRTSFIVRGNYLYTTDKGQKRIGAFNTTSGKYEWIHEESESVFHPSGKIRLSDSYLFISDINKNLHIFEKRLDH